MRSVAAALCSLALVSGVVDGALPEPEQADEIEHLLSFVENSRCRFERNGKWYEPDAAAYHLRRKYAFLLQRAERVTTADFIEHAATASSVTGRMYRVQCPDVPVLLAAAWLRDELTRYRTQQ
jgi:hypothetical protein